jgi:hypothetical protein
MFLVLFLPLVPIGTFDVGFCLLVGQGQVALLFFASFLDLVCLFIPLDIAVGWNPL